VPREITLTLKEFFFFFLLEPKIVGVAQTGSQDGAMPKARWVALAVLMALLFGGLLWCASRSGQPSYNGKSLS
jgi:hypothetical protein